MRKKFLLSKFLVLLILITGSVGVTSAQIVAKIGDVTYSTFADALTAANNMTGDVTVEIYGAGEFIDGMELNGSYTSINFIGNNDEAKLTVNQTAGGDYLGAHGKTVSFTDLILAKANPAWANNSGHMGNYFSIQGGTVTYTNCTFPNGACTSGATATYTDCTFQNSSEYGLWVYDDALVTVNGGTIDSKKGIKVYSEGEESVTSTLTVQNATFTANVTAKPAVAVGYAQSITLIGNTYNNTTAHVELDSGSDADCEGITFVAQDAEGNDIASTLEMTDRSNSNAPCGVLCDGKIYTTVAQAAADATAGSTVTLLYASTETVELPAGVILDTNGYTADGVTVTQPVAQIGETPYYTLAEAVAAAQDKDVIEIIKKGNYTLPEFAGKELTFKGTYKVGTSITDWVNKGSQGMMGSTVHFENLTISGQTENYYGLFHTNAVTYKECIINGLRFLYSPTTFEDCQFNAENVEHSFWTYGASNVTVKNSTFTYTDRAVNCYSENGANHELDITFEGCSFTYEGTNEDPEGAVEINSGSVKSIDLVMNDCTPPAKGDMWFNSQWDSTGGAKTEVIVDNVVVWTAPVKIGETKYGTLQAAIDAAVDGDVVTLHANNAENVTVTQKPDVKFTIDGADKTMTGTITIDGKSAAYATAGLIIKNVKFDANNIAKDASINLGGNNSIRYTNGVTVDNCTFTGTGKAKVAVKNYTGGCKNVTITNCTATGLHSLAQLKTSTTVTLTNNTVSECKNGVSLGSSTGVTVTECIINVEGYGIRPDGGSSVDVTDSEISAFIPVVVRNATNNASLTFNGTNTFTATNTDGLWCAIGTTEYETNGQLPTAPTGDVTVTLNDTGLSMDGVYGNYTPVAKIGDVQYKSLQAALDAAAASTGNVTVEILEDINLTGIDWNPVTVSGPGYPSVTVNGNNKTITGLNDMLFAGTWAGGSGLIINDLTIANSNIVNDKDDAKGTVGVGAFIGFPQASETITLNNCHLVNSTVEGGHWTGGLIGYAAGYAGTDGPVFMELTITGCSVTGSAITGKGSAGGIIGHGSGNAWTNVVIKETTVSDNTITSTGTSTNKAGAIMGTIGAAGQPTTVNGVTHTGGATVSATVSGNTVESNNVEITTIYGRQGTPTGMLELNGGSYDNYPIEEGVDYAAPVEGYEIVENTNGTYGVEKSAVAMIGDVEYKYLQAAFDAAQNDATIMMIADVTVAEEVIIDNTEKAVTLDMNGKTWNGAIKPSNAKLTIKNGTINNENVSISAIEITSGELNLNGVNIASARHAVRIDGDVEATINGGTYKAAQGSGKGTYHAANISGNANVTIEDGKFVGPKGTSADSGSALKVQSSATVTIEGGDFSGGKNHTLSADGNLIVKGGTFDQDPSAYKADDYTVQINKDGKYEVLFAVAMVETTYYADLHEAMVAAKSGETVKLVRNVDLAGTEWEPVSFKGIFDGQYHTISNLTINKPGDSNTGFITSLNGTFKNVTFTNPTVTGGENTAVVAGRAGGDAALAENITINGTIKVETTHSGYARAGGIVGGWAYGNYKNITVDGGDKATSYIKHTGGGDGRYVAGIVGHADGVDSYTNCTVKNITISGGWLCGGIAGPGPANNGLATGCSVENIDMGADNSGGMFGWYYGNGTVKDATVKNVTFTDGSTNNGIIGGYGQNTDANVENLTYENVQNSNGAPLLDHVASIGNNHYFTFEAALDAVKNSETKTITLLNRKGSEISKEIDFTEEITFTITGNAPNYALPIITFQNATVNIENANFQIPELDARQNATINVINSTIVDAGGNSIAKSYFNGAINISGNSKVYMMQVTTMGYINISDNAELHATWQTNVYGNGLVTIEDNATFNTAALHLTAQDYSERDNTDADRVGKPAEIVVDGANFTVGNVHSAGGADYSYNSSHGINVGTVEGKSAILNIKNGGNVNIHMANGETANIGAGGTVNIAASTLNTICRAENGTVTLANNGTVYVTGEANLAANVTGNGWFYMNGVALDANTKLLGAKVRFASGTNNIDGSTINDGFFQVGIGAYNGVDANVDTKNGVVVNVKNAVVGANGDTYAGWAGTGFYDTDAEKAAAMTNAKYVLNIENSIAEFGYLHISNDGELNVNGNATEKAWYNNSNYSFYAGDFIINGTANFNNTDVLALYTKVSCDNGTSTPGTLNINEGTEYEAERHNGAVDGTNFILYKTGVANVAEGANLHVGEPASIAADATMNIGGTATVLGELTNDGTINFTNDDATLATTTEDLTINYDLNPDKKVVYVDGVYKVVEKVYVAKIGDVKFESLQEAIDAAQNDETITLLVDVNVTTPAYGQNALNHARAINFTLDLNGKTLSADTGNSVFRFNIADSGATEDVTVTIKNGTVVSGANTWCTLMSSGISADVRAVMNLEEDLVIENYKGGDFAVKAWANGVVNAEGVTINSTYGGGFYALGGEITLENCTVNQKGLWTAPYNSMAVGVSNGGKMTVNSGTYSAVPLAATDGNNQGTSHGSWTGGVMSSGGTLIINGGTFSNGNIGGTATYPRELFIVGADADYGDNVNGQVIINGGTFTSIGAFIHCETIWGSANDSANDYMPTMGVTITAGDFTAVAGKTIGGCDPVSTGNPVDVEISGGTYGANHAIDNSYLVVGYKVAQIGENVYEVRLSSFEKFYTAAGVETTSDDAAYSLSFTVTDYANNEVSVKIGSKKPAQNSNINLVTPSEVQFEDLTFNVTSVANNGFNGTSFKKVTISEGVETIGNKALYFMSKLTELVLPKTLVSVGEQCIGAYNPNSVPLKSIVCYAEEAPSAFEPTSNASFQTCVEQQTMLIVPNAADYTVYSNASGWKFTNILGIGSTKEIAGKDDKYTLLATVTSMNPMECSIQIGNTKPASNSNAELVIPEKVTFFEGYDFNVTSIPNNAFKGCNNFVGDLVIPATVKTIGYMAFNASHNSNAGALIFAENCELKTIDAWAFNAPFKGDFQLPTSLTSVGVSAFSNNGEGATLTITAGNKGYGRAFSGSKFNKLVVKEGVESLPGLAFYNTRFTEVELPSTLTNIAEGAFDDNTSITTITSNNPVPPTVQVSSNYIAFEQEVYNNATLFVPDHAAKKLYREAYVWKEFANISTPIITQTTQLSAGWNWFSAYVETDLKELQDALGENATIIKNHTTGKWTKYEEGEWYGTLETISPKEMYIINTSNTIELTLVGELVELTPITIKNNWNAIGYMLNEPMSVESALNSIVPVHGDYIKSRDQYAAYDEIDGWYGTLGTLIPGEGYMLKSNYSEDRLLTYSYPTRNSNSEVKDNITTDGNYWTPNHSQYPNNMTMTAMVEVEGGDYEVAAFVDGEVRGSARPIYVEALDAHILFLTIHGDEIEEMTFRYYDIATGEEFELNDRINYSNDAIIGSLTEPYIFNRGTTGIGEASLSDINIYPNPTTTGTEINLQATCDTVEVFNALGVKVAEYHNVDSIDAIETAGIYVIRITNGGNVKHCSLVVK